MMEEHVLDDLHKVELIPCFTTHLVETMQSEFIKKQ